MDNLKYQQNTILIFVLLIILVFIMEEKGSGQYIMPIERFDGVKVNMEVRQRHLNSKKRKVKTWTSQEDEQLVRLYGQYPKKWAIIAELMNDRNQNQCLHRYRRLSQLGNHKKIWSTQEDQTVKKIMKKVGKNWKLLSQMLGTKTGKQIRERFINKLDPKIKKQDWSDEQDRKIIELYSQIGRKWSQISKYLPGRPQNKIKNRFYSYIQKNYDIKYKPIQDRSSKRSIKLELKQDQPEVSSLKQCISLRQVTNQPWKLKKSNQVQKQEKYSIFRYPSINNIDLDMKMDDLNYKDFNNYSGMCNSLVKIEDQWNQIKSKMDVFQGNQQNGTINNHLFYLSN